MPIPLPPSDPDDIRRIAFLGTPEIALPALDALHTAGYEVALVVSGADKRRGRGGDSSPTPVKARALELGLAVTSEVDDLLGVHARTPIDLAIVVAFGQLIRPHVLAHIPMVNIHFSALPRWRGAAPVERAILAGDTETAVALMSIAEGLDEGDVWATQVVPISRTDTLESLWASMSSKGAVLLLETMGSGFRDATPQEGEVSYARKIAADDLELDFSRSADELHRVIRVGNAFTMHKGERFKIHSAQVVECNLPAGEILDGVVGAGAGGLKLEVVQPAGKPRMDASAWANGTQPNGTTFGV